MICNKCGTSSDGSTRYCVKCGATTAPQDQPQHSNYTPPQPPPSHQPALSPYGSPQPGNHFPVNNINNGQGSYAERLHSFGRSSAFLIGVILFSAGGILSILLSFSGFNAFLAIYYVYLLIMLSLPIIGGFLIYAASVAPRLPDKILPALTMYKVATIISMVLYCIGMGILIIVLLIAAIVGFVLEAMAGAIMLIVVFIVIVFFVLYLVLYYVSILRIINGVRGGLITNKFAPLRGVVPLMVVVIITAVFSFIGSIISIGVSGFFYELMDHAFYLFDLADYLTDFSIYIPTPNVGVMVITMLLNMASYIGVIICLSVVSKFSNSMKFGGSYPDARPPVQQGPRQW